jgi:nicotinamidase-related amidase
VYRNLTIWPYHAMLGGIACARLGDRGGGLFPGIARRSQPSFQVKGDNPLTEHYSMLGPEVTDGPDGDRLGGRNTALIDELLGFDVVVVAGEAKSHCMAVTIDDLLRDEAAGDRLAERT